MKLDQLQKPTITITEGPINSILILAKARNALVQNGQTDKASELIDRFRKFTKTGYLSPLELIENYVSIRIKL